MISEPIQKAITIAGRRFHRMSSDNELNWSEEKQHMITLLNRNPKLKHATADSLGECLLQAGAMGLTLNPLKAHCYIIPRKSRKRRNGESDTEYNNVPVYAYTSPSYRGLLHIPISSGSLRYARAQVVYKNDLFVYRGPDREVEYELKTHSFAEKDAIGVYATGKIKSGETLSEYMPREIVLKIRALSDNSNGLMWAADKLWTEGWKKAALRRFYKTIPDTSPALERALDVLNSHEGATIIDQPTETSEKTTELITKEQITSLSQILSGFNDPSRQLDRLAATFGFTEIKGLPAGLFDEAKQKLESSIKKED